ncbi:MAG: 16S rRNA (cytosine(1402)-N(4))-methyltransferase RsmH [Planctomycetaceae bacterium]|jgi:16S rRNA (cytosine1402-N4)-methyltransferase|nr:16S rRNA (cytosine(1402)-N(4))-methyltransferase RsmH [Planctomycetaceae bacterium]
MSETVHKSVMPGEVLDLLTSRSGKVYIDGTLGGGGHTESLCRYSKDVRVIAFDRDIEAINRTEKRLRSVFAGTDPFPVRFVHADYRFFEDALDLLNIEKIDGFLLDLGLSSDQLADDSRGFSFDSAGNLDLRFDVSEGLSAAEMLARLPEKEISRILYEFGEERHSRTIARRIAECRRSGQPLQTARQLADLVRECVPKFWKTKGRSIDPATKTFQALRIAVNDELNALAETLRRLPNRLAQGGIAAVISFHSLEDRIVKNTFRDDPRWQPLTSKPVTASEAEVSRNPRSRSAKLRAALLV